MAVGALERLVGEVRMVYAGGRRLMVCLMLSAHVGLLLLWRDRVLTAATGRLHDLGLFRLFARIRIAHLMTGDRLFRIGMIGVAVVFGGRVGGRVR